MQRHCHGFCDLDCIFMFWHYSFCSLAALLILFRWSSGSDHTRPIAVDRNSPHAAACNLCWREYRHHGIHMLARDSSEIYCVLRSASAGGG